AFGSLAVERLSQGFGCNGVPAADLGRHTPAVGRPLRPGRELQRAQSFRGITRDELALGRANHQFTNPSLDSVSCAHGLIRALSPGSVGRFHSHSLIKLI